MKKKTLLLLLTSFLILSAKSQWSLSGNAVISTNFIGTTNLQNLVFKSNNFQSGLLDVNYNNTFLGQVAGGTASATSKQNSALGYNALAGNIAGGSDNVAIGYLSVDGLNSTGNTNTGIGIDAIFEITTGSSNSAIGSLALYHNTSATYNNAIGINALQAGTTNGINNMMGAYAGYSNTSSDINGMGYQAMYSNTTGFSDVVFGQNAGYAANASLLIAIGMNSSYTNTGGTNTCVGIETMHNSGGGFWNVAVGYGAMKGNLVPADRINGTVAFGTSALGVVSTNSEANTAFGYSSCSQTSTGQTNTGIGNQSMAYNTTGGTTAGNTGVGALAGPGSLYPNLNNATAIGYNVNNFASNQVIIGNPSVTVIGGFAPAGWTNLSDGRFKKNIKENVPGLKFINQLKSITYNIDVAGLNNKFQSKGGKSEDKMNTADIDLAATQQKEKINCSGFIAQDVETAAKKIGYDFSAVNAPKDDKGLYGLGYEQFVVPLVKATQELDKGNDSLQNFIADLQSQINNLQQQLIAFKTKNTAAYSENTGNKLKESALNSSFKKSISHQ